MSTETSGGKLTPAEAAARVGRSERTIHRWIKDGSLAATRDPISRKIRIRAEDLDALVAAQPVEPVAAAS